jgi:hypothetical protein
MKKDTKNIKASLLTKRTEQAAKRASEVDTSQPRTEDVVNDVYLALYSKGLEHDQTTMLADESDIKELQIALETGRQSDFDDVKLSGARKLASPQGSLSSELSGGDPEGFSMKPAPALSSREAAAEMAEVYLKNIMRDKPFKDYEDASQEIQDAINILNSFGDDFKGPKVNGSVTVKTLFRGESPGCEVGAYISQLFLHEIGVGNFSYEPKGPTKTGLYGHTKANYLEIQNGNVPVSQTIDSNKKFMYNGRQLGSTVHIDLVFQHFYEAAAILLNAGVGAGAQVKVGSKEGNFLGGPVLTTTGIAEVARHALRAAWVQKWRKNMRLRPEAMAARVVAEKAGDIPAGTVHADLISSDIIAKVEAFNAANGGDNAAFLPLQYSEGSPTHPAYPAGHATISGACATFLKIMFTDAAWSSTGLSEVQGNSDGSAVEAYSGADAGQTTIHGEINKLAHNIALGRDYAGVHYRSDSALLLGEKVAIQYYKDQKALFNEEVEEVTFVGFDGSSITV